MFISGSASGKDTGFAVRRPLPTETGYASGPWEVQEPMGQQVSREIGWELRTAGRSPEDPRSTQQSKSAPIFQTHVQEAL